MSGTKGKKAAQAVKPQPVQPPGRSQSLPQWAPWGVLLLTALIYARALDNGLTSFDDDFYIVKNPFLRDFSWHGVAAIFSSFYQSNYHPLTTLTYLFEFHFWGLNPLPYHLLNVLLHVVNTWLVFLCCERLSGNRGVAVMVSALFGLHPMHVESVAWISERKDVLYAAFYLLSFFYYLKYIAQPGRQANYIAALMLFALSLLSKSAAVTLPLAMIVTDVYKGRGLNRRTIAEKAPFLTLALIFGIVNIFAQKAGGPVAILSQRYGALNSIFLFTSGIALYLIRCVVPFSLSAMHYFPTVVAGGGLPVAYYLSAPLLLVIAWLVARMQKGNPMRKEVLFGLAFFFSVISVMLQVVSVGSALTAERYTYLSYIGLFYILAQWAVRRATAAKFRNIIISAICGLLCVYSVQAYDRIGVWKNDETLLGDVISKNEGIIDVDYIYLLRGDSRMNTRDWKGAIADYTQAIDINPQFTFEATAYYGRGHAYEATGNGKEALANYNAALELNPKLAEGYNSRGWIYFTMGNAAAAMQDFNTAIALKPDFAEAYNNRGWAFTQAGDVKSAMENYNKAISINPAFAKPYYNRAAIKAMAGDLNAAITDYNYLSKLYPDDPMSYYYRGLAELSLKNNVAACQDWQRSASLGNTQATRMIQQYCQ